jgi:hypothetical protein
MMTTRSVPIGSPLVVRLSVPGSYVRPVTAGQGGASGPWAAANNVEIAHTPTNSSWRDRIEARFTALRYFALDHASHKEQGSTIRCYIIWRNKHAADERLRKVVIRANVA